MPLKSPLWLIANAASGSHNADALQRIETLLADAGTPVARHFTVGESALPTGKDAAEAGVATIVIHGGDGTITSATDALAGWDGLLLILPGGTMNLLSRALHGDMTPEEIVQRATTERLAAPRIPTITGEGYCALAGIIAGPTSAWGNVREHVRQFDIRALAGSVADALSETLTGDDIGVDGHEGGYQAIYLQPAHSGIAIKGVLARNAGDLVKHGWAWLSGDFRDGPSLYLGTAAEVSLKGHGNVGLLIDGERAEAGSRLRFSRGESAHRYLSCRGEVHWS